MRKRFAVVLLASTAVAAVFTLPAHASSKSTHRALRAGAHALRVPKSLLPHKADHVNVAWTPGAPLPVGVAETGGGAAAGTKFYVPGGYNSTGAVVNNLQIYNKTTNAWIQGAVLPGTGGGWADAAICYNSADNTLHVVNGVDGAFLYAAHQVYDVATNTWSFKSFPVLASGDTWYGQDQGCAFIGGKMYLFGGHGIISPPQPRAQLGSAPWASGPA